MRAAWVTVETHDKISSCPSTGGSRIYKIQNFPESPCQDPWSEFGPKPLLTAPCGRPSSSHLLSHTLLTTHSVLPWQSTSTYPHHPHGHHHGYYTVLPWQCSHGIKKNNKTKKSAKMERVAAVEICEARWFKGALLTCIGGPTLPIMQLNSL